MKKILFICLGNVGRSQMAEALYNSLSKSQDAWSAGLQPHTPTKYGKPVKKIVDAMKELGIDISTAQVKTINEDIVNKSEKIIIITRKNECPDFLLNSGKNIFWDNINDPEEMSYEDTVRVRNDIEEKIKN